MAGRKKISSCKWLFVIGMVLIFLVFVHQRSRANQPGLSVPMSRVTIKANLINRQLPQVISKKDNSETGTQGRLINNSSGRIETNQNMGSATSVLKYKYENIMKMKPITYIQNFKNPCWNGTDDNGPVNDNRLHCLPYFYVLGVKKCGTSDLFARLVRHPDVVSPGFKEAQWFPRRRFLITTSVGKPKDLEGADPRRFEYYIKMFEKATRVIQARHNKFRPKNSTNKLITGEGTPANLHIQGYWDVLPGNEGLSEPRFTNLHYIKHLIPDVKIVVIFRNPVDRLYSDFLHSSPRKSEVLFHRRVISTISKYKRCFQRFSFRQCMFNITLIEQTKRTFAYTAGFYAFHMKEIRSVFTPEQILPILFEDYISDIKNTLRKVYRFLDLSIPSRRVLNNIIKMKPRNSGFWKKKIAGTMLNKTRDLLEKFYHPYNEEMAKLMNDDRYLFNK